jgi:hypothetical protein
MRFLYQSNLDSPPSQDLSPMLEDNRLSEANLETDEIMRIMGQYGVDAGEARRIYDEMIYGYERV